MSLDDVRNLGNVLRASEVSIGMTTADPQTIAKTSLRVGPGVGAVALQWLAWLVLPIVVPEAKLYGMVGGILGGGLVVLVWWLFFSRAPWLERLAAIVLMFVAMFAVAPFVHKSIKGGAMGMLLPILAIPWCCAWRWWPGPWSAAAVQPGRGGPRWRRSSSSRGAGIYTYPHGRHVGIRQVRPALAVDTDAGGAIIGPGRACAGVTG